MEEGRAIGVRCPGRSGREHIPVRSRGRPRLSRRQVIASDDEGELALDASQPASQPAAGSASGPHSPSGRPAAAHVFDMEADISELEPATFTTIRRGQPEPMLRLSWHHKVNLIATKVLNPLIHLCEKCDCPILAYGRMIPCKHVLCYDCAKVQDKCWRCGDRATRVEQAGLGKLFMCLHDGKRYDISGCRRTYLSQRDLQAHINHRHRRLPAAGPAALPVRPVVAAQEPPPVARRPPEDRPPPDPRDPRRHEPRAPPAYGAHGPPHAASHGEQGGHVSPRTVGYGLNKPVAPPMKQQQIPVMTTQRSSNLITIPIQGQEAAPEQQPYGGYQPAYSPTGPATYQQPAAVAAATFYQITPPPAAGYGGPFPPSGPPPPAPYGAQHAAAHGTAQPWTAAPPLGRPPPATHYYR